LSSLSGRGLLIFPTSLVGVGRSVGASPDLSLSFEFLSSRGAAWHGVMCGYVWWVLSVDGGVFVLH